MTSFVHEELGTLGQLHLFEDNRPKAVRCVHVAPMFWGPRIGIDEACRSIQEWIKKRL